MVARDDHGAASPGRRSLSVALATGFGEQTPVRPHDRQAIKRDLLGTIQVDQPAASSSQDEIERRHASRR